MSAPRYRRHLGPLVLVVAAAIALSLWLTAPTPKRKPPQERLPLLAVEPLRRVDHVVALEVYGRAEPIAEIAIAPQVTGQVVATHPNFVPGGYISANATIVQLDARDYVAAEKSALAALTIAQEELNLERGRQRAALAEWVQYGRAGASTSDTSLERDLATRGPQLRSREAAVQSAEAAFSRAQLDLGRCRIRIPQAIIVASVGATVGTLARPGQPLGRAYPADRLFVRAALPTDQLRWLIVGATGGVAVWPNGAKEPLPASVREVASSVQEQGSLGEFVVEVPLPKVPSGSDRIDLPIRAGEFVRMTVRGARLEGVFAIPRAAFHRDSEVWLVLDGRLSIQKVVPVYRGRDVVIVADGLEEGQQLVTSQLSQPVAGMRVLVDGAVAVSGRARAK